MSTTLHYSAIQIEFTRLYNTDVLELKAGQTCFKNSLWNFLCCSNNCTLVTPHPACCLDRHITYSTKY